MHIHLISYGDDRYRNQKEIFFEYAVASGFFHEVIIFGPEDIEWEFSTRFKLILEHRKGGGYWIWKPYFVKRVLDMLPDNDILVYSDVGCLINAEGRKRFDEYIDLLVQSDMGSLAFRLPHKEIEYTKQEIFNVFESSADIINSDQLMATVFLLKKCRHAQILVDKWYETLCTFPLLFVDDYDPAIKQNEFIDARHDQSVFSVIRKTFGSEVIADETYFKDFKREGMSYPFWATRLKR